jgi:uncharacterized membrane protein YhaH (DUF805 family)
MTWGQALQEGRGMQWYFERGDGQEGPVDAQGLRAMLAEGALNTENKVWRKGLPDWLPAGEVEELAPPAPSAPDPAVIAAPVAPASPMRSALDPSTVTAGAEPAEPEPAKAQMPSSSPPVYVHPSAQPEPAATGRGAPAGVCGNPLEAFKRVVFENYMNFSGRAPRSEFFWFVVASTLATIVAMAIHEALGLLLYLGLLIPWLAVYVRRLHDIGKSGPHVLVCLVPLIGPFVLLYWLVQDSEEAANSYGPNPKG